MGLRIGLCVFLVWATSAWAQDRVPETEAEITLSFAPVVREVAPAVVNIFADKIVAGAATPFADDPFFGRFMKRMPEAARVEKSLGSGVILTAEGMVVTNQHVVGNAEDISVVLADKRAFSARVVLSDKETDLAILQLSDARDLPYVLVGQDEPEVGDLVLAIGNPFGVGQTVTSGIVSALARGGRKGGYLIQTDAAINPGNSGGALVDMRGQLVGVNTAILSKSGGSNGIGFAIPAPLVQAYLGQALEGARSFAHPWSGLRGQPVTAAMAAGLRMERIEGMLVAEIHPRSPFRRAGLKVGDVITRFAGGPVDSDAMLEYRMMTRTLNKGFVQYMRAGETFEKFMTFGPAPDEPPMDPLRIEFASPLSGLTIGQVNPAVIEALDLPLSVDGVVVLEASGYARRFGLEAGDVLLFVNGREIGTPDDVARAAGENRQQWFLDILRDGRRSQIRFRI